MPLEARQINRSDPSRVKRLFIDRREVLSKFPDVKNKCFDTMVREVITIQKLSEIYSLILGGRDILKNLLLGRLQIEGMLRHPFQLTHLTKIFSVN